MGIWNFIVTHSDWYAAPYYLLLLTTIIFFIGWFFSMDFYDEVMGTDDDSVGFFIFILAILAAGGYSNFVNGTDSSFSLFFNTVLWVIFIAPTLIFGSIEMRKKIRTKRGKQ